MTRFDSLARSSVLLLGLAALTSGCGEKSFDTSKEQVYPVKGKVLLNTGKPLTSGKVAFLPKKAVGLSATGNIGSDGSFSLTAADGREGAAEGEYKVRVEPDASLYSKTKGPAGLKNLPFSAAYMDEDGDTGLTATIKPSENQLEPFKLVDVKKAKAVLRSND
jgi:hypothetical protein